MKKIVLLTLVLGAATAAKAQGVNVSLKGVGYDANLGHVTARLGLSEKSDLDVGFGLNVDHTVATSDAQFQFGFSAFYLSRMQHWGPVDNYLALGALFAKLPAATNNVSLGLFAGLQPEVTLLDRLVVATRFGVNLNFLPNFQFQSAGQGISIVQGLNFKILL